MKALIILLASVLLCAWLEGVSPTHVPSTQNSRPRLLIAHCAEDGIDSAIPDPPLRATVARIDDIELRAGYPHPDEDTGATFWFVIRSRTIYSFRTKDLFANEIWIAIDHGWKRIALTYSDGGAIGEFHVRVFQINGDVVTDISRMILPAVSDFKSRHYCKPRGNNISALKWINGDLLLMAEVYPTGDCGDDMGHIEAYRVSAPRGDIVERLTLAQLKRYPGVCLENDNGN